MISGKKGSEDTNIFLVSVVAIVAIVGLIIFFNGTGLRPSEDVVGEAAQRYQTDYGGYSSGSSSYYDYSQQTSYTKTNPCTCIVPNDPYGFWPVPEGADKRCIDPVKACKSSTCEAKASDYGVASEYNGVWSEPGESLHWPDISFASLCPDIPAGQDLKCTVQPWALLKCDQNGQVTQTVSNCVLDKKIDGTICQGSYNDEKTGKRIQAKTCKNGKCV